MAMLKLIFDFATMLIGTEGARLRREISDMGNPADASAEEAPRPPSESERL